MPTAVLVGTLDTKGREYRFVRERLVEADLDVLVIDVGVLGEPSFEPDISATEVCKAAGAELDDLRFTQEGSETRALALRTMQAGAAAVVQGLIEEGRCDGILGLGGSGGSALISAVMRALPFGLPKVLVSTMASGDVSAYVGSCDLCLMHSVTDIAGINRISRVILTNAAGALVGMITSSGGDVPAPSTAAAVGVTMLGVTTVGALRVVERLEAAGFDAVVFHAVGSGGRALEALVRQGVITGVIDFTIKEVTDDVLGGIFNAGPERLRTAGRLGLPQVVVPGAVEVLNFGPLATVPSHLSDGTRPLVQHNEQVTAVRITRDEGDRVAREIAERLNGGSGPLCVVIPARGFDSYGKEGGPFADPAADMALIRTLRAELRGDVEVITSDRNINDPAFADLVVDAFFRLAHFDASLAHGSFDHNGR